MVQKHHGYAFDLDNPVTFTEKVLWYMCEYYGSEISNITDKVKFKFYIDAKLGGGRLFLCMAIGIMLQNFRKNGIDYQNLLSLNPICKEVATVLR